MVKIAIAGGSGQVAREIINGLTAAKKHEVIVLSRKVFDDRSSSGITYRTVDYDDKSSIIQALRGIHTVLSFIQVLSDQGNKSQMNLIDASIVAGVKRFAPSEWGSAGVADMPWWAGKQDIREYLRKVNEHGKVLEYTLFQPGLFMDYLAYPYQTAKHVAPLGTMFDFENRRAIIVDGQDFIMTFTTVQDLKEVVVRAIDYEGEWPVVGGMRGCRVTVKQLIEVGERVRGRTFSIDTVKLSDLEAGILKTSWSLVARHASVSEEQATEFLKSVLVGTLLSGTKGAWAVSDEFNRILPEYEFNQIEDFLAKVWEGKP